MVAILIIAMVVTVVGLALASYSLSQYVLTNRNTYAANALMTAEAGIEQSIHELNQNDDFEGFESQQIFYDDDNQGRGAYVTKVEETDDSNAKTITSTGYAYRATNLDDPLVARTVKVTVVGTQSDGFSVHTGPGGLILGGSANITNSDVHVNGTITMLGASQIGTESQPVEVFAANVACPPGEDPGPSYPEACENEEAIDFSDPSRIYGSVCATGQTTTGPNNNIQSGDGGEGLIPDCTAPEVEQPEYDRSTHIDSMTIEAEANDNTYTCQQGGPDRTWPNGLQLNGDVDLGGNCNIVVEGDVYITGDITMGGSARLVTADAMGDNRPVVVMDGEFDIGGSARLTTNDAGTGIHFISFKSNAPCHPDCEDITGSDLRATQELLTMNIGGSVNFPGMMFQAYWSMIRIGGSGNIGAATGQTVNLDGAGTVTFGTELSTGSRTWTISSYQQLVPEWF